MRKTEDTKNEKSSSNQKHSKTQGSKRKFENDVKPSKKRVRSEETRNNTETPVIQADPAQSAKKKRKFESLKAKKRSKKWVRVEITQMSPSAQAEHFSKLYSEACQVQLSNLESPIEESHFVWVGDHSLPRLPACIKSEMSDWRSKLVAGNLNAPAGSPSVLVVTYSARRAVEIIRTLKTLGSRTSVCKLFSKHMKVEEQVKALESQISSGVGTPNRLLKLASQGALSCESLELLIVDLGRDAKQRHMFDMKEIRRDFFEFFQKFVETQVRDSNAKICLF
eukprot:228365_1